MSVLDLKLNLGELRHVVEIQNCIRVPDDSGFLIEKWETINTSRAKIEFDDRLMREVFRDEGVATTQIKIFTFRYTPDINPKSRIIYRDEIYEIYGINNIGDTDRFLKVWGRSICQ